MFFRKHERTTQVVPVGEQRLATVSAALVRRGLRDLARSENWLIRKLFAPPCACLALSSEGRVCGWSQQDLDVAPHLTVFDTDQTSEPFSLGFPEGSEPSRGTEAAVSWSPDGRMLIAAGATADSQIHFFDAQRRALVHSFGHFKAPPGKLAWSGSGTLLAATAPGNTDSLLQIWRRNPPPALFSGNPSVECGPANWIEPQAYGEDFHGEGGFAKYGALAFHPDEVSLAVVVQRTGEWADDSLLLCEPLTGRRQALADAQGRITDLHWTHDGKQILFCASGQAYTLPAATMQAHPLAFAAELCRCHPFLPFAACFSSLLKNTARGRLFIVALDEMKVVDECPADDVLDLCWSRDGSKLYAVTADGLSYEYERPPG